MFSVFGKLNFDYKCIVNSREMILVQLQDTIVSDKIKVTPDFYHHYLSIFTDIYSFLSSYQAYKSTLFSPLRCDWVWNVGFKWGLKYHQWEVH